MQLANTGDDWWRGVMGGVGFCWQPPKLHLHEPTHLSVITTVQFIVIIIVIIIITVIAIIINIIVIITERSCYWWWQQWWRHDHIKFSILSRSESTKSNKMTRFSNYLLKLIEITGNSLWRHHFISSELKTVFKYSIKCIRCAKYSTKGNGRRNTKIAIYKFKQCWYKRRHRITNTSTAWYLRWQDNSELCHLYIWILSREHKYVKLRHFVENCCKALNYGFFDATFSSCKSIFRNKYPQR